MARPEIAAWLLPRRCARLTVAAERPTPVPHDDYASLMPPPNSDVQIVGDPAPHPPASVHIEPSATAGASALQIATMQAAVVQGATAATSAAAGLDGAFAVCVKDPRTGRAALAVDRFGQKTLCYRVRHGVLQVATRADELADPGEALDHQALFDYLYFHCIPSPRTIYRDVRRLPAGHLAWFEDGQVSVFPYWVPEFLEPARAPSFTALREEFLSTLRDAVASELRAGLPACFLSGGTDSSTVAGLIGQVAGQAAHTFSIGFEAEGYDEMEYARVAARHFATEHHEYYVTPDDLVRSVPTVARWYDQPFGNSSALPAYYCARLAIDQGSARMLAGDGGDELFGGNTRYAKQRVFDWYRAVPHPLRTAVLDPVLGRSPLGMLPGLRKARSYITQANTPLPERTEMYNQLLRLGIGNVLTARFIAQVDPGYPRQLQREVWDAPQTDRLVNRMLAFDWRFTLAENDLPKVRETCALAGVSVGFPMLDRRLLDFSLRLPAEYKLKGLRLRWFFKEALRGFLPDAIIAKKKHGFGLPFGVWLTRHAPLMALAEDSLNRFARRGIVREDFIRSLMSERLAEHPGYYGEMIWILMMLEQWLQHHAPEFEIGE